MNEFIVQDTSGAQEFGILLAIIILKRFPGLKMLHFICYIFKPEKVMEIYLMYILFNSKIFKSAINCFSNIYNIHL